MKFLPLLLVLVLLILCAKFLLAMLQRQEPAYRYKSKRLLTDNEREFFARLVGALPEHFVFPQVSFGALLQPDTATRTSQYHRTRGTFSQKIADYVICTKELRVLAIVELDDRTHNSARDGKRDAMLKQAGYTVIRWHSRNKPTGEEIRERLRTTESEMPT